MSDSHEHVIDDGGAAHRSAIWRTFWILSVLTAIEFIIAFYVPKGYFKVSVFIVMTIIKAFFIVGEFMHLKYEVKGLIWSILLPCVFVLWLLGALIWEGGSVGEAIFGGI